MGADRIRHEIDVARGRLGARHRSDVRSLLGPDHPLAGSTDLVRTLAMQAATTAGAVVFAAIAAAERVSWGARMFRVAMIVELLLIVMLAITLRLQREDVLRVIAGGGENLPLAEVTRATRQLANPMHVSDLADRLALAFQDAREWRQCQVASRRREGVKLLQGFGHEIGDIVGLLRTGEPTLRGLALLEVFLISIYRSVVYLGGEKELQQQLWRIRYLLTPGEAGTCPDRERVP